MLYVGTLRCVRGLDGQTARLHRDFGRLLSAARPSKNLLVAAWQSATIEWWETQRWQYDIFLSSLVMQEASRGDGLAAARRIEVLRDIPLLDITEEVIAFSENLLSGTVIPRNAADDALHIAIASVHGMDYLLTWNCRHIENAQIKPAIRRACAELGYTYPEICTPSGLMGVSGNGG